MLRIRLSRKGKKKQPQYRVVVADVKFKRDGRFVENIGFYNPLTDPPTVDIKEGRALYWLSVGAQPSDPVKHLLEKQGTYDRLKRLHAGEELDTLVAEFAGEAHTEKPASKAKKSKSAEETPEEVEAAAEAPAEEDVAEEDAPEEDVAVEAPGEDGVPEEDAAEESADDDEESK